MKLPEPGLKGKLSFEEAVKSRKSIRNFSPQSVSLQDVSQILWAAQGIVTKNTSRRTCPSAGALYPIEMYVEVREVEELEKGIYHYDVFQHSLEPVSRGDYSQNLTEACLTQLFVGQAPVVFIIGVEYSRITWKYGERGIRYVHIEVGHCGQNICLQATALGLATVPVGAFWDREVQKAAFMPQEVEPVYVIPVGYPEKEGLK